MLDMKECQSVAESSGDLRVTLSQHHSYRFPPLLQHTETRLLGLLRFSIEELSQFVKVLRRGVSMDPGAKELTVIPCLPTSNAEKD